MCGLRKSEGFNPKRLITFLKCPKDFESLISNLKKHFNDDQKQLYFKSLDAEKIALTDCEGFLVSNALIVEIMSVLDKFTMNSIIYF